MSETRRISQADLLDEVERDITYAIECLLQDYTGEAKGELWTLIGSLGESQPLDEGYRTALLTRLEDIRHKLAVDNGSEAARLELVRLRRRVMNTRRLLLGQQPLYGDAPLSAGREQGRKPAH